MTARFASGNLELTDKCRGEVKTVTCALVWYVEFVAGPTHERACYYAAF